MSKCGIIKIITANFDQVARHATCRIFVLFFRIKFMLLLSFEKFLLIDFRKRGRERETTICCSVY